jgi:hypothetical protein
MVTTFNFSIISHAEVWVPPTITSVSLDSQNEVYKKGDIITINIEFNKNVTCDPKVSVFEINIPTVPSVPNKVLTYKSGNGTNTLSYEYIVDDNLEYNGNIILFSVMGSFIREGQNYIYPSIKDDTNFSCLKTQNTIIGQVNIDTKKPVINQMTVYEGDFPSDKYAKEYNVNIDILEKNLEKPSAEIKYYWSTDSNRSLNKSDYNNSKQFLVGNNSSNYVVIPSNILGNVEGIYYLHVWIEDNAGNATTGTFSGNDNNTHQGVYIDKKPPVITFEPKDNTPQKEQTVTIKITDLGAGVKGYKYSLINEKGNKYVGKDNDEYFILDENKENFSIPIVFRNIIPDIIDGKYQLEVSAYDEMLLPIENNTERNYQNQVKSILYTVDTTKPNIKFDEKIEDNSRVGFEVTLEDVLSNKITLYYSWENDYNVEHSSIQWKHYQNSVNNKEKNVILPDSLLNSGAYYLFIKAVDEAGNESISNSTDSVYIPEKPTGTIAIMTSQGDNEGYTNDIRLNVNFTVSGEKTPLSMRLKIHNGNWLDWEKVTSNSFSKQINLTEEEGNQTIFVQYKYDYHNKEYISDIYSDTIIYDKTPPVGNVSYSTKTTTRDPVTAYLKVTDNINSEDQIICNPSSKEIKFDENGNKTFTFTDLAGNVGTISAKVDWIINEAPRGTITYSTLDMTRNDVTATLTFPDYKGKITIENNNGKNSYVFTKNGSFTFNYINEKGKVGHATAIVNNIDRIKPEVKISYSKIKKTNHNVRVTFIPNETVNIVIEDLQGKELKTINAVNKQKLADYTFEKNGIIRVKITDIAGNETNTIKSKDLAGNEIVLSEIEVNNIDKTPPVVLLTYAIIDNPDTNISYEKVAKTKENVSVTVSANEDFVVLNNNHQKSKIFTENGEFIFNIADLAGNVTKITATVNKIDKSKPKLTLSYSTKEVTKDNVYVTLKSDREINILNNNGSNILEFTENGMNWFKVRDKLGNIIYKEVYVTNIDRIKPKIVFENNETLLLDINNNNNAFDPMEGVKVIDNVDGDITNRVKVEGIVNLSKRGKYIIRYLVSDKALNKLSYDRIVQVLSDEELVIYVDSECLSDTHTNVIRKKDFVFNVYGIQGDYKFWWDYGKQKMGYFKRPKEIMNSFKFSAVKTGWYTFYILDQERKYRLFNVFMSY